MKLSTIEALNNFIFAVEELAAALAITAGEIKIREVLASGHALREALEDETASKLE